ncbi:Hypothetical predicted protein [Cloeon dipterum]|uniref:Uncharacterized protein n=1 Tax=Cloeon dipterum TaxID=197152 RepID=A0A8S1C864_9INSE|nr:Hypothetical predicted protein [Cloeon dipterum]
MAHTTTSDLGSSTATLATTSETKHRTFWRRSALKKLQGCRWNKLWALALGVLLLALSGLLTVTLVYALARQVPFDVSTRSHARFYFTTNDARCTRLM